MPDEQRFVIVTGANRGIGFATARKLAERGAHVVMAVRDVTRGQQAAAQIRAVLPDASLEVMALDLGWLGSVRAFADAFRASGKPLHALINNAGPVGLGREIQFTRDGFEMHFGTNHLGHFLLTNLLLPILKASAPSRVITVSSMRHTRVKTFDFENLRGEKSYHHSSFYDHTKLANIYFGLELQRRLAGTGVISIMACPGFVPETLVVGRSGFSRWLMKLLERAPFARRADQAAEELAAFALDPTFTDAGGTFFSSGQERRASDLAYDETNRTRLWTLSERLTNLENAETR